MSTTAAMLAEVPLFAQMDGDERALLAERMEVLQVSKGETVFSHGDVGDSLMIVRLGRVQVFVENTEGEKIILGEIEPGELMGEISLFDPGARSATAVAVEDSELLVLDHDDLWQTMQRKPHIALHVLAVLGKRLRATDELLRTQVARNVNEIIEIETTPLQRVADLIAEFSGSMPFLMLNAAWFVVWIGINTLPLGLLQFDPYPFGLLTMIVSLEAIFLSCFVLISQNRQSEKDHLKADVEYQVNLKAELEVAQLHNKVDKLYEAMQGHFSKLEKRGQEKGASLQG
jgi:CRP/FNR family transcriptional regulator, cyclic AMP receptor protein